MMKPAILALDLEGTLTSNAITQIPRPGLYQFLEDVQSHFNQLMMFTTVPEERFRGIADLLSREDSAPAWFASLHYVQWTGNIKDLLFAASCLGEALLLDDHGPYIHPGQEQLWFRYRYLDLPILPSTSDSTCGVWAIA